MDTDDRQGPPANHRGGFYLIKGIPIATIVALFAAITPQTIGFVWYLGKLEAKVDNGAMIQSYQGKQLDALDTKMDAVKETLEVGKVPSAINSRRIDDNERVYSQLMTTVALLQSKVNENAARIIALESRVARMREK